MVSVAEFGSGPQRSLEGAIEAVSPEQGRWAGDLPPWTLLPPGLTYPLWRSLAPEGATDPAWVWYAIGACFVAVPIVYAIFRPVRPKLMSLVPALASMVTLHFFLLASFNDMYPFYAVGSAMAGMAPVLLIRSRSVLLAYCAFILVLAVTLYAVEPDERKLAYWLSLIPVFGFAVHHVSRQASQRQLLQDTVADRTRRLSEANRRLRSEIAERARLEDALRVHEKMEAVGRLAGGVAHDFNNLLTTIGVYAELLEKGLPANDPLRSEVAQIQRANRQAASLTQQLLTVGRRSHVDYQLLDLNQVLAGAASVLSHLVRPDTELVYELDEKSCPILADPDQLQQILINLVTNARDAIEGPGLLILGSARRRAADLEGLEGVSESDCEEYVRLSVSDSGKGMAQETLEKIFDPFFTTKGPGKGVGLGLAIVHGIVSQAGGFVRVRSQPGRGTRFDLYWPRASDDVSDGGGETVAAQQGGDEEILLVEDEAELRSALGRVLRERGYRVEEAGSGEEALALVLARDRPFDLLVTDVIMVPTNGFELARQVGELHPTTRVLLVSGHLGEDALRHLRSHLDLLPKPFAAAELIARVRRILDEAKAAS